MKFAQVRSKCTHLSTRAWGNNVSVDSQGIQNIKCMR